MALVLEDSLVDDFRPSAKVTLPMLHDAWSECQACDLGVSRVQVGGSFVFGEGATGGIMFIGEGPEGTDEVQGRPFTSESGRFLRGVLQGLGLKSYYLTNAVCCRSWDYAYDTQGNKIVYKDKKTHKEEMIIRDQAPKPAQRKACLPRLAQHIYTVDPVLIVALGGAAAETLLGRSVSIQAESGTIQNIRLPGAGYIPQLTPKGAWARSSGAKAGRHLVAPIKQNEVTYPLMPLISPSYAAANQLDRRHDSIMGAFSRGLQKACNVYAAYRQEVYGEQLVHYDLTDKLLNEALEGEEHANSDFD